MLGIDRPQGGAQRARLGQRNRPHLRVMQLDAAPHVVGVDELQCGLEMLVRHQESQTGRAQHLLHGDAPALGFGAQLDHLGDVAQFALVDLQAVGDGAAHLVLGAR